MYDFFQTIYAIVVAIIGLALFAAPFVLVMRYTSKCAEDKAAAGPSAKENARIDQLIREQRD